jgi:hypothetical protein
MKKLYFCILILLSTGISHKTYAQIPNASFENWTGASPDGWSTLNILGDTFVVKVADPHAGNFAAKSQVLYSPFVTANLASSIVSGPLFGNGSGKFACTCRPDAVHFWYKFIPAGGEAFIGYAAAYQGGAFFSQPAGIIDEDSVQTYKEGIIDFKVYLTTDSADTMSIGFQIQGYPDTTDYTLGTYFIVDDISFGPYSDVSVKNQTDRSVAILEQNVPNPTSETTNIIYSLTATSRVSLKIYDLMGRDIKNVLSERQTPGRYKAIVDLSDIPAGNYLYKLEGAGAPLTKMLVVIK